MAVIRNPYEKKLDKSLQSWYNTRKKERVKELTIEEQIKNNSINHGQSLANVAIFEKISKGINTLAEQGRYAQLRSPVIAGGAVRDTFFGLPPNDWDIFFDISSVLEDDREDFVLMYLHDLLEELRKDEILQPRLINAIPAPLVGNYTTQDDREQWEGKNFIVYQTGWDAPDVEWPMIPLFVQTIGREDARLTDDPSSFLDEFDYCAVKALYDPATMRFVFHEEFKTFLDDKKIVVKDNKTLKRVNNFTSRFWPTKMPFKVIDKRPKESVPTFNSIVKNTTTAMKMDWDEHLERIFRPL